ncbi:AT-rich interaction domain 6 [Odontesthes bonariensis]|uniref:AT-rich interaction domain 6 n=1 Tax=Odontesthes bonariensis TaxID=219752 RepID=UPI003F580D96
MAHKEFQEERNNDPLGEMTEGQFLKNLYLFMKKRDTPIERIPNLGFKQIDLFVMFKTVNDLGGYNQVTSHQLWKQVYNTLGGNPRSTSAATCTRRHYEKLLLPFECQLKGILESAIPQHQPKPYPEGRDDYGGQRPSKRRLLSLQLDQRSHDFRSNPHGSFYPLPPHYPHYYHPSHPLLPPHPYVLPTVLIPHGPHVSKPQLPFQPSHPRSNDTAKDSLEQLRNLAERYKSFTEPLNLSVKASTRESNSNPISSFSPPSSKNPKFLNKPSPLYTAHHGGLMRNKGCETQDGESSEQDKPFSYYAKTREAHSVNVEALTPSQSPIFGSSPTLEVDKEASEITQKPSSPKPDFTMRSVEDREASPEVRGSSHIPQSLLQPKEGRMEIEVPLSVFRKWLTLCGSSAMMHEAREPPLAEHEESSGRSTWCDLEILPDDPTFHMNPQHQSTADDLRVRNELSRMPNTLTASPQYSSSQNHLTAYKPLCSGGIPKNAASWDTWPFGQQDVDKSYNLKSTDFWDVCGNKSLAPSNPDNNNPLRAPQDFTTKFYGADAVQAGQRAEKEPSTVLVENFSSGSALHLTTDEVMKLKKIISSSS